MTQFASDYTPTWRSGASATGGDFETTVDLAVTGETSVDEPPSEQGSGGPVASAVASSPMGMDEWMVAASVANVALFAVFIWMEYGGGGSA